LPANRGNRTSLRTSINTGKFIARLKKRREATIAGQVLGLAFIDDLRAEVETGGMGDDEDGVNFALLASASLLAPSMKL